MATAMRKTIASCHHLRAFSASTQQQPKHVPNVRIERLPGNDKAVYDSVANVVRRGFFPREWTCLAAGVGASSEAQHQLLDLVRASLLDGVSVGVYEDDVLSTVAINKIHVPPPAGELTFFERFAKERASHPAARWVVDSMVQMSSLVDLYAVAGGGPLLEIMFLAALPEAGMRGLAIRTSEESVNAARAIGAKGVFAVTSSEYSRAISRRLGFQELAVVEHSQLVFNGKLLQAAQLPKHQQQSALVLLKLD